LAGLTVTGVAACGGGERQDENEPKGNYRVDVVRAAFPAEQSLAKTSNLVITVRNAGSKSVPNVAVTVKGFDIKLGDESVADPNRPQFVINGDPKEIGGFPESKEAGPEGGETAYVNTWALGELKPNEQKTFRWKVTAVRAGPYRISYSVAGGLDGKAKAVDATGSQPRGQFAGRVQETPPRTRVADDGRSIVQGTR
jgi:hypothetical protein